MSEHVHHAMGRDDFVRPDGVREVWWKCICGLEEKRFFEGDVCLGVKYRWQGIWSDARDWIALTIPVRIHEECDGIGCHVCNLNGVVEDDGSAIVVPPPAPVARRAL